MRASIIILVVASALVVVLAQTTPMNPDIPKRFTCTNCTYTFITKNLKYSSPGKWWYDAVANMMRQDFLDNSGNKFESLAAIGHTPPGYECQVFPTFSPPSCNCDVMYRSFSLDIFHPFHTPLAEYRGSEIVNGIECDIWLVAGLQSYSLWVQSSNVENPVRLQETAFLGDVTVIDFNSIKVGAPDSSIFNVPSYCKNH